MKKSPKNRTVKGNDESVHESKKGSASNDCNDKKCPFHGKILVKKEEHHGKIIKKDSNRSATIEWERQYYIPKYERYERRWSRLHVHNPPCIDAQVGDTVRVARTRPLSKTKYFAIVEVVKKAGGST